mgnify:CR=1 FL=1
MMIVRIWGLTAEQQGSMGGQNCPTVAELADGNFAIVGDPADHPAIAAHIGPGEAAVTIPRHVMLAAARQIAAHLPGAP